MFNYIYFFYNPSETCLYSICYKYSTTNYINYMIFFVFVYIPLV